jgi:hypothetical protein
LEKFMARVKSGSPAVNASGLRDAAIAIVGEDVYFEDSYKAYNNFKEKGITGLRLIWGTGMDELGKGWEKLYKGTARPDEGLVFDLASTRSVKL